MIRNLGDNFESIMTSYFEDFRKSMKAIYKIPTSLVEKHAKDIFFLIDIDFTYAQATLLRVRWLRALTFDVNIDETSAAITTLLFEYIDSNIQIFGKYQEAKARITMNLQTPKVERKRKKIMKKLQDEFGGNDEEDEANEEVAQQGQGPYSSHKDKVRMLSKKARVKR